MRYEITDYEWDASKAMLRNKPRGGLVDCQGQEWRYPS